MNVFLKPMLAESIDPSKLPEYGTDDAWFFERKVDGHRLLVIVQDGRVSFLNRSGEPKVSGVTPGMEREFKRLDGTWAFDGEIVDSQMWLFDMPMAPDDEVTTAHPYDYRRTVLDDTFANWQPSNAVRLLPCHRETPAKLDLAVRLIAIGAEGVMVKHRDAPYHSGKRTRQMLKAKFTKTADVVVTAVSPDGKDSLAVGLYENGRLVDVGKSSTIGKGVFSVGEVIEVRYLYVVPGGKPRLYQPTILCKRDDKKAQECTMDQLQYTDKTMVEL